MFVSQKYNYFNKKAIFSLFIFHHSLKKMQTRRNEFPDFAAMERGWLLYLQNLPVVVGETAVNFFKDSFDRGGFIDKSFERWTPRKDKLQHKLLLKTFFLKNSIQVVRSSPDEVEVASVMNTKYNYAEIHNNGGIINIPVTAKSRKFFWFMYKATKDPTYKNMALSKKETFAVKMPKRQFIGESEFLMKRLEMNHNITVEKIIKTHFK
jgi:phage gpG-like protein